MNYRKGFERIGYSLSWIFMMVCFVAFLFAPHTLYTTKDFTVFICLGFATCLISFSAIFVPYTILLNFFCWIIDGFRK